MAIAHAFRLARDLDLNSTAETFALVRHCCAHLNGWFALMIDDGRGLWMVVIVAPSPQCRLAGGAVGPEAYCNRTSAASPDRGRYHGKNEARAFVAGWARPAAVQLSFVLLMANVSPAPMQPRSWRQADRHGEERSSMRSTIPILPPARSRAGSASHCASCRRFRGTRRDRDGTALG